MFTALRDSDGRLKTSFVNENVYLGTRIIKKKKKRNRIETVLNFPTFSPGSLLALAENIMFTSLRDSTAVYRSFVNENAFFQATIDNLYLCYVFKAFPTDAFMVY